jgi:hypothetical protein
MARSMKVAVLVMVGVLAVGAPVAAAPDPARIDRAADRVIDGRYQDLPQVREDDLVSSRERSDRTRRRRSESGWSSSPGGGGALGALMSWLVWGAIAVGAVLLVLLIVRELLRHRRDRIAKDQPAVAEEAVAPAVAALHRPLDDADQLAREGRFAEAIHVLLLRTFEELARAAEVKIAPSLTSREILARIPLRAGAHEALADLASVVELTWFGDDVPGEADWLRCRGRFDVFVSAYRGVKEAA